MTILDSLEAAEKAATAGPFIRIEAALGAREWQQIGPARSRSVIASLDSQADAELLTLLRNHAADLIAVARAADDLLLWEPGRKGDASARSSLFDALAPLTSQGDDEQ